MSKLQPTVSKGILKAHLLEYLRKVEKTGSELIITDNRIPVLKIVPLNTKKSLDEVFHKYRGKMKYSEDLTSDTSDEWEDLK